MGEERLWRSIDEKYLHVLEFPQPHILDDGKDELRSLLQRRLVCAVVGALGFLRRFRVCVEDGCGIVIDRHIIGSNSCGFGKLGAIARCVRCHCPNEADKVMYASYFIMRDLEEERRHTLPDLRKVGV